MGVKTNTLRLVLDGEFETIQLDDNPTWLIYICVNQLATMKKVIVECLRANANLFPIFPSDMSAIDSGIECH